MKRRKHKIEAFDVVNTVIMLFIILVTLYPVYYVVIASFSDPGAFSRTVGAIWKPIKPYSFEAYKVLLANSQILTGFKNTMFVLVVGLAVNLVLTSLGAYFLACKGPMLRSVIAFMIIFTMYFSGGLVPEYLNVKDLGLLNSRWSLILPVGIYTTNLIILKSAFQSIPDSLIESARLDGASHFQILWSIMLPLSKASLAVIALYYGVSHWNSWFNASIYLRDPDLFPIQLVMRNILIESNAAEMTVGVSGDDVSQYVNLIKYALIVVATAPIVVLYPFLQKYFVKGVMVGAVKG